MRTRYGAAALITLLVSGWAVAAGAQQPEPARGASNAEAGTAQAQARIDLSGYWVSVVTEDWRWRMVTPPKGDYAGVPLSQEGRRAADQWDGDAGTCRPYGAANLLRMPTRLEIAWEDGGTLRLETDHGMQIRRLQFTDAPGNGAATRQGRSLAEWDGTALKVVTSGLLAGHLRRNGVPYSADTLLTEYFDRHSAFGEEWLTVTTIVRDPAYLTEEFITSSSFKRLADGAGWNPTPCREAG